MKTLIVYDSLYGNTEQIARAIGSALTGDIKVLRPSEVNPSELKEIDLLIVGSPTQGGRATLPILEFLMKIPETASKGINAAAFDTRLQTKLVKIFGYATGRITEILGKKGALVLASEGFFVKGKDGPLKEGELERAAAWAKELLESRK